MKNFMFIDIDGPLLPGKSYLFPENRRFIDRFSDMGPLEEILDEVQPIFDPFSVRAHNLLAKYGDAEIVLVTNWRSWVSIERIQQMFDDQGLEFKYADQPTCVKRGLTSERVHDVATHVEDYLPENSRALIIDDDPGLTWLNEFWGPDSNSDGNRNRLERNVEWKLLHVDYQEGLTYDHFKQGVKFFDIDTDQLNHYEFGAPLLTEEEKQKKRDEYNQALDILKYSI